MESKEDTLAVVGEPKAAELKACSIDVWYPKFEGKTFKTKLLQVPTDFHDYLHEDGVVLPQHYDWLKSEFPGDPRLSTSDWSDDEDEDTTQLPGPFKEVEDFVKEALNDFGAVVPKLNWSAPRDASWMFGNLQCTTPGQVYTLLKSSELVHYDLDRVTKAESAGKPALTLALRKWFKVFPDREFRCFIREGSCIAISQRHADQYHKASESLALKVSDLIVDFVDQHVAQAFDLASFVLDVYVSQKDKVWIIDFAPWHEHVDPLLFEWEELNSEAIPVQQPGEVRVNDVVIRYNSDAAVKADPMSIHRVPLEVSEAANEGSLQDLIANMQKITAQQKELEEEKG